MASSIFFHAKHAECRQVEPSLRTLSPKSTHDDVPISQITCNYYITRHVNAPDHGPTLWVRFIFPSHAPRSFCWVKSRRAAARSAGGGGGGGGLALQPAYFSRSSSNPRAISNITLRNSYARPLDQHDGTERDLLPPQSDLTLASISARPGPPYM